MLALFVLAQPAVLVPVCVALVLPVVLAIALAVIELSFAFLHMLLY